MNYIFAAIIGAVIVFCFGALAFGICIGYIELCLYLANGDIWGVGIAIGGILITVGAIVGVHCERNAKKRIKYLLTDFVRVVIMGIWNVYRTILKLKPRPEQVHTRDMRSSLPGWGFIAGMLWLGDLQ